MGTRFYSTSEGKRLDWEQGASPDGTDREATDEAVIRGLFHELLAAWGRGDATGYGALFTEDADYVAFDGSHTKGRRQIAASHQELFDRWLRGTRLTGHIESLRFLSPQVALVHAIGGTVFPGELKPRPSRDSIQTLIAIKHDDSWRFAAFHNTRILRRSKLQWILYGMASRLFRR
jgi:uncharacterized protein (TIGR02246 family)